MARPVSELKERFNAYPLYVLFIHVASLTEIDVFNKSHKIKLRESPNVASSKKKRKR
jgi:hypothetical protein